jgi:long-chain acyl-CoA synthetase
MNIAQGLLNRARIAPDAPALSDAGGSLDFGQLADRATRIAASLRGTLGLNPGDRVMLLMENRREFIEALFACWVAGLCAVPVNAKLHGREVAHIASDCDALALFTSEAMLEAIGEHTHLAADTPLRMVAGTPSYESLVDAAPTACAAVDPADPAWLFYTSGTTGTPKGATLSHRNLLTMVLAYYADIEAVSPGRTMLHAAPLSHGAGMYALPHLLGGGHQMVVAGFDAYRILDAFERHPSVSMFAAPTMLNRLVRSAHGATKALRSLRTIVYGGAPMYVNDLQRALDVLGPRLYQLYGQGEAPMTITGLSKADHQGPGDEAHLARLASCGLPRTGVEVRVVNDAGEPAAFGEAGEIVTRSDCVMRGYWNNPKANADALRDGWLRTGDIGEVDANGFLRITDRKKDLIKTSGGKYIAPQAIEGKLKATCPYLSQVIVHGDRRNFVTALVTLDAEAITKWAKENGVNGSYSEIVTAPQTKTMLEPFFAEVNKSLAKYESVKKFEVLPKDLEIETGELTPSLKVKRKVVEKNYASLLDGMYEGAMADAS